MFNRQIEQLYLKIKLIFEDFCSRNNDELSEMICLLCIRCSF